MTRSRSIALFASSAVARLRCNARLYKRLHRIIANYDPDQTFKSAHLTRPLT